MSGDEGGCSEKQTLNLSKQKLKKVPKQEDAHNIRKLILDENELQKIDNIDSYLKIETLSLAKNQLLRMYGVCRLHCLRELNLSFNGILSIEGLKDCLHLRVLNLEGNNIKTIEHLSTNVALECLNLAENSITSISDISYLGNLKELYLHGNRLTHLRQCDKYLPTSLETLTLAKNNIDDLNEICTLSHLSNLLSLSINDNGCVNMSLGPNSVDGFDYRPFVLNWCMSLKCIDGYAVDPIESLKAEWLYSQGRGRQFRVGEQPALAKHLSTFCPLVGKALENEDDRKLRLILSKAQHHQRQLQEEIMDNANSSASTSPSSHRRKPTSRIQSPRFSRLSGRQGSPESMVNSYHGNSSSNSSINDNGSVNHSLQMSISLIENIKNDGDYSLAGSGMSSSVTTKTYNSTESTPRNITPNPYNDQTFLSQPPAGGPLAAASKMVPVPETLMSPDVCPAAVAQRVTVSALNSQLHKTKINKNKDNKLNLPRVRSPLLKRTQSPTSSPRKVAARTTDRVQQQQHMTSTTTDSTDDDEQINIDKLTTIRKMAAQRNQQQQQQQLVDNSSQNCAADRLIEHMTESSAVIIQKMWRGYYTRKKHNPDIAEKLQRRRVQEYIEQLSKDMRLTKAQLENERKIQQLQMQAINALWKKVSSMHVDPKAATAAIVPVQATVSCEDVSAGGGGSAPVSLDQNSASVVNDLAQRCTMLTDQVQQLQSSIGTIVNCLTMVCNLPQDALIRQPEAESQEQVQPEQRDCSSTQTDLIAVHTPQMEDLANFPFTKPRPSTLALESKIEALPPFKQLEPDDGEQKEHDESVEADA
ncbi:centrosomal protein of 97 kDa isoform X1 [Drosophila guanche]|uniref:Centrosomal protein of 97 kDa n=1 Tax=Drosophila guanche TaxID=7266 RepID=A0A3B0K035_DROGU|nr:centrosomal protein of 97 kDa isoform X1 [Drosophila guanche]SPP78976.1 blast:Centrosomal protein of 97 kDa [Drosophila guanche]